MCALTACGVVRPDCMRLGLWLSLPVYTVQAKGQNDITDGPLDRTFGPWTFPHTSLDGCQPKGYTAAAGTSDAWPFGMCTLKRLDPSKAKRPPLASKDGGPRGLQCEQLGDEWVYLNGCAGAAVSRRRIRPRP